MKTIFTIEEWRPIPGYEGLYQASFEGEIKSLLTNKILKSSKNRKGYLRVTLCKDCKKQNHSVHRLIALAWIPNPLNLPCINHRDGDTTNNAVTNLEWCDYTYNNSYGLRGRKSGEAQSKPILQYTLDGKLVGEWSSAQSVQKEMGWAEANINGVCNNKYGRRTAYGYIWKFKNP